MAQRECLPPSFTLAVLPPPGADHLQLLLAAGRAGELPIVDAARPASPEGLTQRLAALRHAQGDHFGLRVDQANLSTVFPVLSQGAPLDLIILAGVVEDLTQVVDLLRPYADRLFREVIDQAEVDAAIAAGIDGLIARGNEGGGRVSSETTFVLVQRLTTRVSIPIWVQGGITPNTTSACLVAGATGFVLDSQLALAEEADTPEGLRALYWAMDGTETICLGDAVGQRYRVHRLRGTGLIRDLQEIESNQQDASAFLCRLDALLSVIDPGTEPLWPIGQEAALAGRLASRYRNVAGILRAFRQQAIDNLKLAVGSPPLCEDNPLALACGIRYPIFQGPMTRVSDVAAFADAVASAGGLPFLALAVLREPDARRLLEETATLLGERPWGVGILAFVSAELRAEQMRAVLATRPKFALLAGGRPDQARELEQEGIITYLHTPSPRLLEMFLREGARRFVFEGRECGGHVGPLSSFLLWDSVLDVLLHFRQHNSEPIDILFAGGIHDGLSAAMVSALAAPAVATGMRIGVLMGTAYLFTHEAVKTGAIVPTFQELALSCEDTVLLDAQGGHAIRCLPSEYAGEFNNWKRTLIREGVSSHEARERLEELNLGRLRIASKGLRRTVPMLAGPPDQRGRETHLAPVSVVEQKREGMYMIGQVGALHRNLYSIAELHADVCEGSARMLDTFAVEPRVPRQEVPIAIIGMTCIFPDAPTLDQYWANILRKHNAIREVPKERWHPDLFYNPDPLTPDRVISRWGGFLAPVPFDPLRYGIPPTSIPSIEPIQLLVLEIAQRALEHAGYHRRPFPRERTAVIIGAGGGACDLGLQYQTRAMAEHYLGLVPGLDPHVRQQALQGLQSILPTLTEDSFPGTLCNVAAGRVANRFDLAGPNYAVDAACASSLAALDMAVMELRQRTSDMVFLGGGDAQMNISSFLMFSKTHALSPRGRCRPFDASADGIAISEGLAGIILKRLDDALRDGDRIYAILRSVGSASDGRDKSLTAPSLQGQKRTLERAYQGAGFASCGTVGLLEAHGTGTVVGDRTELEALCEVFLAQGARAQSCALGSVKSQIGHTKNGAGVAGLIKAVLALHHRTLPPTVVEEPSPAVRDRNIPFYLNTRARPWFHTGQEPRRAGVSAFGFGGTNFHVVLEEYPGHAAELVDRPAELVVFRATSREELATRLETLDKLLGQNADVRLIDLAALSHREAVRSRGDCRLALVVSDINDLRSRLIASARAFRSGEPLARAGVAGSETPTPRGKVAFLFPGQGSQYLNMLEELALYFPIVRELFEQADRALADVLPMPLTQVIFPPPAYDAAEEANQRRTLDQTWYAQPALGAADFAVYSLLRHLGIEPDYVAGHSYGEYVALCAAGVFSFTDLARLSEKRGRIVQETQGREAIGMLAVQAAPEKVAPLLERVSGVSIAACNAPEQTVLGGSTVALDRLVPLLTEARLGHQRLAVSAGFHIPEARPAADRFLAELAEVSLSPPRIPVWSNRTATVYPSEPAAIRHLLHQHLIAPVQFRDEIEAMFQAGCRTFVEVGPGQVLSGLVRQTMNEGLAILPTNRRGPTGALTSFLEAVAQLWVAGCPLRGERLFSGCDIRLLEMANIGNNPPPLPPTTWFLDGGSARPLKEPTAPVRQPVSTNGIATPTSKKEAPPVLSSVPTPAISPSASPTAVEVMNAFQTSMRQFLDYQARAQEQRQALMQQFLQTQTNIVQAFATGQPLPSTTTVPTILPEVQATVPREARPLPSESQPPLQEGSSPRSENPSADLLTLPPTERNERLQGLLLELVSERTGYPQEMLELDHNMEADLGIDSIKRTEIFGGLRDRLGFHGEVYEKEEYYIKLGKLRTLREVLTWLTEDAVAPSTNGVADQDPRTDLNLHPPTSGTNGEVVRSHPAYRLTLDVRPAPLLDAAQRPAREREVVLVTDGPTGRARELFAMLRGLDYDLAFVRHASAARIVRAGNYEIDLLSPDSVKQLRAWIEQHHGKLTALCHLLPLEPTLPPDDSRGLEVRSLFHLSGAFGLDLLKANGTVLGVTTMGGTFAVGEGARPVPPGQAGVVGFLKSLAREWPGVHVKAVDIDPDAGTPTLLGQIVTELRTTDSTVEIGYGTAGRCVLDVVVHPVQRSPEPMIELDSEAVVLVLGGARGITASITAALARQYRCQLVIVGRSPLPDSEHPDIAKVDNPSELKRILAERRRRQGELVTPVAIESEFRALLASRELRGNLEQLRQQGARFGYHSLDVRDEARLTTFVRSLYEQHGRLDGVIHAAGLLGDSLLVGKTVESFDRAFDTKVKPALVLARELRPDRLRFLVFFSSVAARFGNVGQTDYAAANEVLNKLARRLDHDWPARVVSIGWGPWDEVGMARPEKMSAEYLAAIGFAHMPVAEGCEQFLNEIAYGHKGDSEVLLFRPEGAGPQESSYSEAQFYLRAGKPM
jgi:acyl transferase domain-containing protein/NAD(P)H-dependent flavin oxidoreductase YrpB (nitropropane dioxygenase family)/NAD(P)-dependent dehydrogenase (short-subunit alcohol dehydrogenase family)